MEYEGGSVAVGGGVEWSMDDVAVVDCAFTHSEPFVVTSSRRVTTMVDYQLRNGSTCRSNICIRIDTAIVRCVLCKVSNVKHHVLILLPKVTTCMNI